MRAKGGMPGEMPLSRVSGLQVTGSHHLPAEGGHGGPHPRWKTPKNTDCHGRARAKGTTTRNARSNQRAGVSACPCNRT